MLAVLLPIALAFLMLIVGLSLETGELIAVLRRPKALLVGLAVQVLLLPLLGLLIAKGLALPPKLALGLMIIAICPGGITSNYVALLARADVALSTAMSLITNLIASTTIPFMLSYSLVALGQPVDVSVPGLFRLALVMTGVTAAPLIVGLGLRRYYPSIAESLLARLGGISKAVFAAIVLATFMQNRQALLGNIGTVGFASVLLNVGATAIGLATAALKGISRKQALAIGIETGLQNAAVAIFLCTTVLSQPELAIPGLLYAIVMNVTALILVLSRHIRQERLQVLKWW